MALDDSIKTAQSGVALVGEMLKAAGDNPNVKEAGLNLGQAALTITKTINNALLPLAAVNYAFDKARIYFSEKFQQEMAEKTSKIPLDQIVDPKASIAGPALQGLAFTHDEPELKDMYLNLLANAMDGRVAAAVHPAFVEVIRQLSSADAYQLRGPLQSPGLIPIVEVQLNSGNGMGYKSLAKHVVNLTIGEGKYPIEIPNFAVLVDNWVRLGLVNVDYSRSVSGPNEYAWVENRPEVIRLRKEFESETEKLQFANGNLSRTDFGTQFARSIGLR